VGVDVAAGLGLASTGKMRFFRPATAGVIGAALAVARIDRVERVNDVLGLAYSQAAGTMQAHVEGSVALPLQIANAARAAVTAADLAAAGLSGPHDVLEGPFGYFRLFEEGALPRYTDRIGARWLIEEVGIKPYPSGRASHGVLGTLAALVCSGELDPSDVVSVEAHVPPLVRRLVDRPMSPAMTPSHARLCLPWLTALMLINRRIDPRSFTPAAFADPKLAAKAALLKIRDDGNADANALEPQRVVIALHDGRNIERLVEHSLGSPEAPLSDAEAGAKLALALELAGPCPDQRIFDDPLDYFTVPQ
jgi:2-methylcitrate dehydratase PrpD